MAPILATLRTVLSMITGILPSIFFKTSMIVVSYICILCIILLLMEFYYTMLNYEHLSLFLNCIGFVNHVLSMGIVQVMNSNHVNLNRLVTLHIKHRYI